MSGIQVEETMSVVFVELKHKTARNEKILWFLHKISITIQFKSASTGSRKRDDNGVANPLQFGITLLNLTFSMLLQFTRLLLLHLNRSERWIESSGWNQNILNARIKFFRLVTLDFRNLFRHWLKCCVKLRRIKGSRGYKGGNPFNRLPRLVPQTSFKRPLSFDKMSSPLIINLRLI